MFITNNVEVLIRVGSKACDLVDGIRHEQDESWRAFGMQLGAEDVNTACDVDHKLTERRARRDEAQENVFRRRMSGFTPSIRRVNVSELETFRGPCRCRC